MKDLERKIKCEIDSYELMLFNFFFIYDNGLERVNV